MVSSTVDTGRSNETEEYAMTQPRRYHRQQQKARQRRLRKARERLQREQARAQRTLQALEQAIGELGLPEIVVADVEWRLQAQGKLLGKIFGMMFPPFLGAGPRTSSVGCAAGTSTGLRGSWAPCPSKSG